MLHFGKSSFVFSKVTQAKNWFTVTKITYDIVKKKIANVLIKAIPHLIIDNLTYNHIFEELN